MLSRTHVKLLRLDRTPSMITNGAVPLADEIPRI
jgi:hypothetical protein